MGPRRQKGDVAAMFTSEQRGHPRERETRTSVSLTDRRSYSFEGASIGLPAADVRPARAGRTLVVSVLSGMLLGAVVMATVVFADWSRDQAAAPPAAAPVLTGVVWGWGAN